MAPYLDIRNYAVDTEMGNIRRDQENRSLYQKEYRKHEKQARDDAYGRNQEDDQGSQAFSKKYLVMDLNNTGNAFAQAHTQEESSNKSDRRGREKSENRRRRDD